MMTIRRLGIIPWNQKGFTLIEIVVALAISALIGSAVATASYQVFNINSRSTNHQIAVSRVQNAVNSISHNAEQAQQVIPTSSADVALSLDTTPFGSTKISFNLTAGDKLIFKWFDWTANTRNQVVYTVVNGTLQRAVTIDGTLTSTTNVAENISTPAAGDLVHCYWDISTKTLNIQIKTIVGTSNPATEIRTFQIIPRSAQ